MCYYWWFRTSDNQLTLRNNSISADSQFHVICISNAGPIYDGYFNVYTLYIYIHTHTLKILVLTTCWWLVTSLLGRIWAFGEFRSDASNHSWIQSLKVSSSHYISQRTVKYWLITLHFLCSQTNKQRIPTSHPVSTEKNPTIFGSSRVFLGQKLPHHNSLPGVENFNSPNTRMLCFVYWFSRMVTVWSDAFQSDPLISGVDGQTVNKSCPLASRGWREVLEKRCFNPSWFKQEAQELFFFLVEGGYIFSHSENQRQNTSWGNMAALPILGMNRLTLNKQLLTILTKMSVISSLPELIKNHPPPSSTIIPTCDFIFGLGALTPERTSRWWWFPGAAWRRVGFS